MLKTLLISISIFTFSLTACSQPPMNRPQCANEAFDEEVSNLLDFTVPTLSVKSLKENIEDYIVLDAREIEEYEISHIPGAKYIGYDKFDKSNLKDIDKDSPIVLYCSVGYRSEKIGEKLQDLGYTNVSNLYGSIFEWANQGYELINKDQQTTNKVHTYNKNWSKWVDKTKAKKVY